MPENTKHVKKGLSNETAYGVCKFNEVSKRLGVKPPVAIQNDGERGVVNGSGGG